MTARRVLAVLLLVAVAGCEPQSHYRVPDSGAPAVWVTPSTYPAPGPCGGVR